MALLCRLILVWAVISAAGICCRAAAPAENRAFDAAVQKLNAGFYQQAEADFAEFVKKFPASPLLPEAVLFQAEARIKLTNYAGALDLLGFYQSQSGKRADEYLFWQAEALSQKGDLPAAADSFGKLARNFPDSPRRLEATVREAMTRSRLSEWPRAVGLLQETNGVFQAAVRAKTTNEMIARGYLLLAEGHMRNAEYAPAEQVLQALADWPLNAQLTWQRQNFFCRLLAATGRGEPALQAATNLLALAASAGAGAYQAESFALYAELLEQAARPTEALAAYKRNLACGVPPQWQRQSVTKVTELSLALTNVTEATQALQTFIEQCPGAPCGDLALLTLGELQLREHQVSPSLAAVAAATNAPTLTNRLQLALTHFQALTNKFPQSPLVGKALLDAGWCFWLENRMAESQLAFESAIPRLPASPDQAIAYFKLGDTQFRRTNFHAAVGSYTAVIDKFTSFPQVTNSLFEPALYEIVRAGLADGDLPTATNALGKIRAWFPNGSHMDRAVLLVGQEVGQRDPSAARSLFSEVQNRAPNSPLLPELQLAIAHTYEQEDHWTEAIAQYAQWLAAFTNHPGQARAEYSQARAYSRANLQTNAFALFTNFLARFPKTEFAPLAQWWVAGYYYRVLGDLKAAEQNYQIIFQNTNWPVTELTLQARMMAGRVAFERGGWTDARRDYFGWLASDTNCPPTLNEETFRLLRAQAWIALGDTLVSQDSTNKAGDYNQALTAYEQVFSLCPSNQMAALAWGQKASCLLQYARSSEDYAAVTNAFQQVLDAPQGDVKARSIAKVGMGVTFEKMAQLRVGPEQTELLNLALSCYLDVFYQKILRENEKPDSFWTREAGLKAARLAESLKLFRQAANLYQRLQDLFPPLRLEGRINNLRALEQAASQKS